MTNNNHNMLKENEDVRKIEKILSKGDFNFKPFFSTRVMAKIDALQPVEQFNKLLIAFQQIVVPGIAIILIFLASLYFIDGGITWDSLMGTDTLSDENLSAFLLFE